MNELLKYLFDICGIDRSPDDTTPEEALTLIKQAIEPVRVKLVDEAVAAAIAADKIRLDEKDWARGQADKSLKIFRSFVKYREPVHNALLARMDRAPGGSGRMGSLDREMARQMGCSEETWLRYNSPAR